MFAGASGSAGPMAAAGGDSAGTPDHATMEAMDPVMATDPVVEFTEHVLPAGASRTVSASPIAGTDRTMALSLRALDF